MKVSIITVCYNSEKTIEKTLQSILNQSYKNYEYIIIDGNSSDSTIEIIKKYEINFGSKLTLISEKDSGIYDAMNKGIKQSKGDIVAILNSDDFYMPKTLELVVNEFENTKAEIISGKMQLIDKDGKILRERLNDKNYYKNIKKRMCINHPATFLRKEVYLKEGGFDISYRIAGDYDFLSKLIIKGYKIKFIDEVLVKMLIGGVSANRKFYKLLYLENKRVRKKYFGDYVAFLWSIRDKINFLKKICLNVEV